MSKDVIADFLTIIRNGVSRSKSSVRISYSSLRYEIAQILKQEGFVSDVVLEEKENVKTIKIVFYQRFHLTIKKQIKIHR